MLSRQLYSKPCCYYYVLIIGHFGAFIYKKMLSSQLYFKLLLLLYFENWHFMVYLYRMLSSQLDSKPCCYYYILIISGHSFIRKFRFHDFGIKDGRALDSASTEADDNSRNCRLDRIRLLAKRRFTKKEKKKEITFQYLSRGDLPERPGERYYPADRVNGELIRFLGEAVINLPVPAEIGVLGDYPEYASMHRRVLRDGGLVLGRVEEGVQVVRVQDRDNYGGVRLEYRNQISPVVLVQGGAHLEHVMILPLPVQHVHVTRTSPNQ